MSTSFTIKIGADTKTFMESMKGMNREINQTQKSANDLEKSLDFKYDEARAVQAMGQFQRAIELCDEKAEALRAQLKHMDESGKFDKSDYAKLQLELARVETQGAKAAEQLEKVKNIKIEQLNEKFEKVGDSIEKAGQKVSVFSAAAAAAIAGAAAIGKSAAATGAEIDDMTQQFDVSAETVQRWNYLALQSGVDATAFSRALIRARAAMADLSTGTANAATETLTALGISARQFGSDEEMFDGIVKALAEVEDGTLQTAYANELFGDKIATQLLPYINAGAADLAKWNAEFEAMPSLTGEEAAALAELDDTFNRLSVTMQYATAQLGEAFAPIIERVVAFIEESVVPALEELAAWFESLSPGMQDTILAMLGITAVAGPLLILIGKMVPGLKAVTGLFSNLRKVQLATAAGFAAIAGAAFLAFNAVANWSKMSTLGKILSTLAIAALTAAAAVTVFHASWSLGAVIGVIAAGVTAGIATIKAASEDIMPGNGIDFSTGGIEESANGVMNGSYTPPEYSAETGGIGMNDLAELPDHTYSGGGASYTDNTYADQYNVTVNVTSPGATAEEIAAAVGREIATLAQSRR